MIISESYPFVNLPNFTNEDFIRAVKVLEICTQPALPQVNFPHPFVSPGGAYGNMWWQLDFSLALLGLRWLNPKMALESFMNFETAQKPDGRIPLWGNDTLPDYKDGKRLQREGTSSFPRLFDAAAAVMTLTDDGNLLNRILNIMLKYLDWWFQTRQDSKTNLISAVFEETFIPYYGYSGEYAPVDLNIEVIHGCRVAAALADRLRETESSAFLRRKAEELQTAVRTHLWNPEDGLYAALLLEDKRFNPVRMARSFAALRYQTATSEQQQSMLRILTDPERFGWGRRGLTSVDRTDPDFTVLPDYHRYNGNPSWSGSLWAPINENVIRGLRDCGEHQLSADLAGHTLEIFRPQFCEFVNPDTGSPCGVMDYAWTAALCMDIIFTRICGISFDASAQTLRVSPNLPEAYRGREIVIRDLPLPGGRHLSLLIRSSVIKGEIKSGETIQTFEAKASDGTDFVVNN